MRDNISQEEERFNTPGSKRFRRSVSCGQDKKTVQPERLKKKAKKNRWSVSVGEMKNGSGGGFHVGKTKNGSAGATTKINKKIDGAFKSAR